MAKIDLSKLSIEEMQALAKDIEQEITTRKEQERERVLSQMRELAGSIGLSLEDLLKQERGRDRAARVPAAAVSTARYRHPENAGLTWAGRGKRPQWVTEWLESGRTMEELEAGS
jgi:DNA-binding protein H-NS